MHGGSRGPDRLDAQQHRVVAAMERKGEQIALLKKYLRRLRSDRRHCRPPVADAVTAVARPAAGPTAQDRVRVLRGMRHLQQSLRHAAAPHPADV